MAGVSPVAFRAAVDPAAPLGALLHKLRRHFHVALEALHAPGLTDLDNGYAPVATGDTERSPGR
jgi:hypothetical protein